MYRILELSPKTAVSRASTRATRENGALAFAESACPGAFFVVDQTFDTTEKFTLYSVAADSYFREADDDISPSAEGHLAVQKGAYVIDGLRHSCVSAGGTVFSPTGLEVVVPITTILAFDLQLEHLVQTRVFRDSVGNRQKWQMSSDDHARVLRLLSDTLDDQVARAVEAVSGRS